MLPACPECGAQATPETNCQSVFDEFLALEFTDPGYGAVHHLTVAAYMLQHSSKLSRAGWLSMRQLLIEFLLENKSPLEVRKQNRSVVDSSNRTWKISTRNNQPVIGKLRWTKTILDVRHETAAQYCADIAAWARASLEDVAGVEPK